MEGTKRQVYLGTAHHTAGGLVKSDLKKKDGRIVSKAKAAAAKHSEPLAEWRKAVSKAKRELGIPKHEFVLVKGALHERALEIYHSKRQ
jgi:hypothetical protein